MIFIEDPIAIK